MSIEKLLKAQADQHPDGDWMNYDDFYQELYNQLGEMMWPSLPKLLGHASHDARCCGLILAGKKRPESREIMLLIAPFMLDPHPLVRLTAFKQLLQFSWVHPEATNIAYKVYLEDGMAKDQAPRVLAIRLLLKSLVAALRVIKDLEFGESLVTHMVDETLKDLGKR